MKKNTLTLFFVLVSLFVNAQMTGITAKLILDNIEASAENILYDAQYAGDELVNNATQNLLYSVREFRQTFKDVLGQADRVLTGQQELLFNNLKSTSDNLFKNISEQQALLNNNINSIGNILSNTIISNKNPIVTSFKLPILVEDNEKDFEVTFFGVELNENKNYLELNGKIIPFERAITRTDNQVSFRIDNTLIPVGKENLKLVLHLHKRRKDYPQNFEVRRFPNDIAKVDVTYLTEYECNETFDRTVDLPVCRTSRPDLSYPRENNCSELITPTNNNRVIRIGSVRTEKISDRYGRGRCDLGRVTQSGIQVTVHAKSERTAYGGSGRVNCRVTFQEVEEKTCEKIKEKQILLKYNEPKILRISEAKVIQSVKVTYYNGQVELFNVASDESSLISYFYSPSTKTISISTSF